MARELICRCRKRFAGGFHLDALLRLPLNEARVTVLYGPSGAGKTTLLRLIAGLATPDDGEITFDGVPWFNPGTSLAPQQRRAGFLFQDGALFPHLTVAANVEFAARSRAGATKLIDRFGLTELNTRLPRHISGGQQQRVALARALAAEPSLLLLDEPLSALDLATRLRTRAELRRTLLESGAPAIVVTHDRSEAIALADWVAVMIAGRVRQAGPASEVFARPADAVIAESLGVENILAAEVRGRHNGVLRVSVAGAELECVDDGQTGSVLACIRAEDVAIAPPASSPTSARNRLPALVREVTLEGVLARVDLDCGFPLAAALTAQSAAALDLAAGRRVDAVVKATAIHLVAR
jgi:molybdate transport system ATP-binding protein